MWRVALALATEGIRVTGLDLSEQMLDVFRTNLADKPELADKITFAHGNMADFSFYHKFGMVLFQRPAPHRDRKNRIGNHRGIFVV